MLPQPIASGSAPKFQEWVLPPKQSTGTITTALSAIASVPTQPQSSQLQVFAKTPSDELSINFKNTFSAVDSSHLVSIPPEITSREAFLRNDWPTPPPLITVSSFVPKKMIDHLMRNKKNSAIGIKYKDMDQITNMEGALHTFVTPIALIHMLGDYAYQGYHSLIPFKKGLARQVIMSAAIQPDFERSDKNQVMLSITKILDEPCEGAPLPKDFSIPSREEKNNPGFRGNYDESLRKHLIYHLTAAHRLPSKEEILARTLDEEGGKILLENAILKVDFPIEQLSEYYICIKGYTLSAEVLFNIFVQQIRNEFSGLDALLPQGYIYTFDPAVIFATKICWHGSSKILNRFQILAFKHLLKNEPQLFNNLKMIGFNDFDDHGTVGLFGNVFQDTHVLVGKKSDLFPTDEDEHFSPPPHLEGTALVIHNNSDAFGQNIETESAGGSLDGQIGSYSDAACVLRRNRPDLLDFAFYS